MATKANTTAKATTAKRKAAPANAAQPAQQATQPQAPQGATLYTYQPRNPQTGLGWPKVHANSIRAYCQQVAQACAKAHPKGFTLAQYTTALATSPANGLKQPGGGWGAAAKGYPVARQHAGWFAAQGWLVPVA